MAMRSAVENRRCAGGGTAADPVRDLEERLSAVVSFASGILFELDRDGHYLDVWTSAPDLLILPREELIGRSVIDTLGPDHGGRFVELFRSVLDQDTAAGFEYTCEVTAGRRTFVCMAYPSQRAERVMLVVRDVTEARRLEAQVVQSERLAALGMTAASVGHEIRQPLAYAMTELEVLGRAVHGDPRAEEALAHVRSAAARIAQIAASLDLVSVTGRERAPLDLRGPLLAALDLGASAVGAGVRVIRELEELPPVVGHDGELCQVFLNLLLNAAQAVAGKDRAAITVRSFHDGVHARVSVTDDGSGIRQEDRSHIFDPFFTTKADCNGRGIGLFTSREIVHAHGGTIEVTSREGQGTTMEVVLPVAALGPTIAPAPASGVASARCRILVVDDEPRFLESLVLALSDGHDVVACDRAPSALAMVREDVQRFDVVLCDLSMADVDGVAFFEEMRALGAADRFVVMTAGVYTERAAEFVRSRVCPCISKPFALEDLDKLVARTAARVRSGDLHACADPRLSR
jgi:signal transduction histidine kinase/CheY-like chemotaxis protein